MAERKTVIIDAGHGGANPGAVYMGRQEKDDALRLALAVGNLLEQSGVNVLYTRVNDVFDTPLEKAQMGNQSGADYFISIHRNAMPIPGSASGAEVLVYQDEGVPALLAENISRNLTEAGFADLGVKERPGLIVLRRTQMPAVLVEAGFIDKDVSGDSAGRATGKEIPGRTAVVRWPESAVVPFPNIQLADFGQMKNPCQFPYYRRNELNHIGD